ncbi:transposase, partial [Pseudoalteromonas sp. T1lg21]|uniref:transposase n=1 Tax=Pseudoalteromonas sp. T1lg21 TaxID=2077095 RepID=UPI003FA376B5
QQVFLNKEVTEYRARLSSISWFMRMLNEYIARRANKEDECTGHFWEGRFKSQALLDEPALLACMAYVDLNPVRAKVTRTPEQANYTSFKKRCQSVKDSKQPKLLARFVGGMSKYKSKGIPFELKSYLLLVEQTGRCICTDKPGYIEHHLPPILERLNFEPEKWLTLTTQFENLFHGAAGRVGAIERYCSKTARKRRSNLTSCKLLLAG